MNYHFIYKAHYSNYKELNKKIYKVLKENTTLAQNHALAAFYPKTMEVNFCQKNIKSLLIKNISYRFLISCFLLWAD